MPRRADLPTADEFFDKLFAIRRPTWSAIGTIELAKWLGVHQQTLWNRSVRDQMPPSEDPDLFRAGNRKLYRLDNVLSRLPGGEGSTAWEWTRKYLGSAWDIPPDHLDDRERMLRFVSTSETK